MDGDQRPEGGLAALDLLAGERLGDEVEAGAAVLLGDHDPEQAQFGHALDDPEVEVVVDVVLDRLRQHALVDERADGVLDQTLLGGELEVHGRGLVYARCFARWPRTLGRAKQARQGRRECSYLRYGRDRGRRMGQLCSRHEGCRVRGADTY